MNTSCIQNAKINPIFQLSFKFFFQLMHCSEPINCSKCDKLSQPIPDVKNILCVCVCVRACVRVCVCECNAFQVWENSKQLAEVACCSTAVDRGPCWMRAKAEQSKPYTHTGHLKPPTSSVMESSEDVASSYSRMEGLFRMARAMATRCFSPPVTNTLAMSTILLRAMAITTWRTTSLKLHCTLHITGTTLP